MAGPIVPQALTMDPDYSVIDHINRLARAIDAFNTHFPEYGMTAPYFSFALVETLPMNAPWDSFKNKYRDLIVNGFPNWEKYLRFGLGRPRWTPTFEELSGELLAYERDHMVFVSDDESESCGSIDLNKDQDTPGKDGDE